MNIKEVIEKLVKLGYTVTCFLDDGEMLVSLVNEDVSYDRDMASLEELYYRLEEIENEN